MGADYSIELISIETYAPQFIGHNKIVLGSVSDDDYQNRSILYSSQKATGCLDAWPTILILNGLYSRSPKLSCLQVFSFKKLSERFFLWLSFKKNESIQ